MCSSVAWNQVKLDGLVFFRYEGGWADLDEALFDEDLEILRGRERGTGHHPDGVLRPYVATGV
jgi:hypothetical protein